MENLLLIFVLGWFGANWWPGQERGAVNPKDPHPWEGPALGIIGGLAAVLVARISGVGTEAVAGAILSIASGNVAKSIVAPVFGSMRK